MQTGREDVVGNQLKEYDGFLSVRLSPEARAQIEACTESSGVTADVAESYLEVSYKGRDTTGFVVDLLAELAPLIGTADGEIRCEIDRGDGNPRFEFYRFENGELLCQTGTIKRGRTERIVRSR